MLQLATNMYLSQKVISLKKLIVLARQLKNQGKKIVTCNGSFDIIHVGHIKSIQEAKRQGDVLFILVNSDQSVKSYKGPSRPIIGEKDRAETVAGIEGVDYVTIFDDITPVEILDKIKPHIHCNGSDWGVNCIERDIVEKNGGRIHVLGWEKGFSTSKLIQKIINVYSTPVVKAVFLDRDGTINNNKDGYIHKEEDFEFLPGVVASLQKLTKTNYKIVIVTNQSGIGRGKFTNKQYKTLTTYMLKEFKKNGVRIDKVYYCPHHPEAGCECRKPKIGMLLQAVKDFGISLNDSWFIGDDDRDVIAGRNANVKTIKLGAHMPKELKLEPNHYVKNMDEAVGMILG
ncbi:MAG: D-glycero-D-manno-heptose 1,7-bisphosphate phosphatase [Microgenomates group bacterium Gr01-1014_16]|nr:MAG: D-glycero-D-manno-heptose 1,7-bisphosphate phosphatase [Microgenomates group bacterium Gr01-1014_16]